MEVLKKSGPSSLNNVIVHDKQIPTQGPVNLTNSYRVMDIDVVGTTSEVLSPGQVLLKIEVFPEIILDMKVVLRKAHMLNLHM